MKIITKYSLCVILALTLIVLPSCSMFWSSNPTYSGGQILDEELMSSIRNEILSGNTESSDQGETNETTAEATEQKTEPGNSDEENSTKHDSEETHEINAETTEQKTEPDNSNKEDSTKREPVKSDVSVYWTKSGGVYHFYKDCGYIKSSSEIISGTVEEALEAGKTGVCSRCENRKDKE